MSNNLYRDTTRLVLAAQNLGITNIERDLMGPVNRWHFALKGQRHKKDILMAFDPRDRKSGGAQQRHINSFREKRQWAIDEGCLWYTPKRYDKTYEEVQYRLKKWMILNGLTKA